MRIIIRPIVTEKMTQQTESLNDYGFMVDKNAPWRLVFNIASGAYNKETDGQFVGAQKYLDLHGASYKNVFQMFYTKTHLADLENLRHKKEILSSM